MCRKLNFDSFKYNMNNINDKEALKIIINKKINDIKKHIFLDKYNMHEYEDNFNDIKMLNYILKDMDVEDNTYNI